MHKLRVKRFIHGIKVDLNKLTFHFLFFLILLSCSTESSEEQNQGFEFNFPIDCCEIYDFEVNGIENVEPEEINFFYACVFSPDGPTANQNYFIQTNEQIQILTSFEITNQEGNLIYSQDNIPTNSKEYGWDGKVDQEFQEGPYKVSFSYESSMGTEINVTYIICSLICENAGFGLSTYVARGLSFNNLRWPSQHDGQGGFDETSPIYLCE